MARYRIGVYAEIESEDARDAYAALSETFRLAAVGNEPGANAPESVRKFKLRQNITEADLLAELGGESPSGEAMNAP